jgi:hypothetical protein
VIREITGAAADRGNGTISTVAGTPDTYADSGDGGPATAASLDSPFDVAVDAAGDLYIADTFNNVLREVTPNGTITTIAGLGPSLADQGNNGEGGPAVDAELNTPESVAVDSTTGDVYVTNRLMHMSAWIDPNGTNGGPALDNNGAGNYTWTTYAEQLQNAGVTWKVYQESDNYGCNALQYFGQFNNLSATDPLNIYANGVSTLYDNSAAEDPTLAFEQDAAQGSLPTVSWIIPTSTNSEHPPFLPAAGANFVASKLAAVAANPDVWNSTVFILNYDENDGFFDHVAPITPPLGTPDEFVTLEANSGYSPAPTCPSAPVSVSPA